MRARDGRDDWRELTSQIQYRLVEELQKSNARYRSLVAQLPDILISVDAGGAIEFVSPAWNRVLGHRIEDSVGQDIESFIHPEDQGTFREHWNKRRGDGVEVARPELRFRTSKGTYAHLEIGQRPTGGAQAVGCLRDVTGRIRAEQALAKTESALQQKDLELGQERFQTRLLLQAIHDAVLVADVFDRIRIANNAAQEMLEDSGTLVGLSLADVLDRLGIPADQRRQLLGADSLIQHEVELPGWDRCLRVSSRGFANELGQVSGRIFVIADRTAERESQREKDRFLSSVSHELRTPLTSIYGFTRQLVRRPGMSEEDRQSILEIIEGQGLRLRDLIEDLLMLGHAAEKRSGAENGVERPREFLLLCVDSIQTQAQARGIDIAVLVDLPEGAQVAIEERSLRSIVVNLLDNAVKFSADGARIELQLTPAGEGLLLVVRDDGCGIPEALQQKVFERFYRAPETAADISGTGLGLAIVKEIASRYGGEVELKSGVGQGTQVAVRFPTGLCLPHSWSFERDSDEPSRTG